MNHFILSDSRKCIGCQACEVACVMAHNEEQHALTPQRFLPRITVIKAEGSVTPSPAATAKTPPASAAAPTAPSPRLATAFRSVRRNALAVNPAWWPAVRGDGGGGDAAGRRPGESQRAEMRSVRGPRGGTGLCGKLSGAGADPRRR